MVYKSSGNMVDLMVSVCNPFILGINLQHSFYFVRVSATIVFVVAINWVGSETILVRN